MRVGIKFGRCGMTRFVSHLDVQSMFARALRRTGIAVRYSQGFNPHIVTSFASAMPVGLESRGEYLEFYAEEEIGAKEIETRLGAALPEGFFVVRAGFLPDPGKKLMALLEEAEYEIGLPAPGKWQNALRELLSQDACLITRMKKGRAKQIDIRPLIREAETTGSGIRAVLALSGAQSLGPALFMEAVARQAGEAPGGRILRTELFTKIDGKRAALEELFLPAPENKV